MIMPMSGMENNILISFDIISGKFDHLAVNPVKLG